MRKSISLTSGFKGRSGALEVPVLMKRLIVNLHETGRRFIANLPLGVDEEATVNTARVVVEATVNTTRVVVESQESLRP